MEKANLKTENLKKEVIKIFKNHGLSNPHAVISTNALINAELVGAYGHGLSRLRMYCERISEKVINPKPNIKVKKGDVLLSLEAMKMEYSLKSPRDGIIEKILIRNGQQVTEKMKLIILKK